MSPASQGNLEVERYIGSCLISSSVRVNNIGGKNNSSGSHSNVNYKGKKVPDCGGSRVSKLQSGALSHRTTGGTSRDQIATRGYSSQGNLLPVCECGGLKFGGAGYGSPGPATGVGGSWAGLPLISMAPSNSRRNRKPSTCSNGSVNNGTGNSKSASSGSQATAVVANPNSGKNNLVNGDHISHHSRTPLSRLAIHTQGAPLILAGRYTVNGRKSNIIHNRGPPLRQFRCGDLSVRRSNSARDTRDTGGSGSSANGNNSNTPSSDCLSVTSDESSGHSENSLPRIIKPRKRRKKDRKPPPLTATSTSDTSSPSSSKELKNPDIESPSIVTLKPYVPLCYELYDSGRWIGNRPSLAKQDTKGSIKVWEADNRNTFTPCNGNDTQEDEHVSQTTEDDSQEPKLHHNFDEVEDGDGGLYVDSGALFPYPCPPTLCHCRYCDPSGLIWDVDQHCYSPFLTPPPPTVDNKSTSSPFANIPLFLTPPPTEVRSFDFFTKDLRSTPSPLMFHPENDNFSVLRRSWSEPLPSSFCSENITSSNEESRRSFGIIGHGRVREVKNVAESQVNRLEVHSASAEVSASTVSVMTSQSLEVSTEIVTSPNGHRDIEIKFYSSSPPADTAVVSARVRKDSCGLGVCDGNGLGSPRASVSSSVEDVCSEGAANDTENTQQENGESSVKAQAGNGTCKQDAAQRGYGDSVWVGDGKEGCSAFDHGFCEQSAKSLGEEVDQLHLHAEE